MVKISKRVAARLLSALLLVVFASALRATTFRVPADDVLINEAHMIVSGVVEGSYARPSERWKVETVYQLRVQRSLKGGARAEQLIEVVSPGGYYDGRGILVDGAAHFANGEKVLLFLDDVGGTLEPLSFTLGKFRHVTSETGDRLLLRDLEDGSAFDSAGRPFTDKVRREEAFVRFIQDRVKTRRTRVEAEPQSEPDYFIDSSRVSLPVATDATTGRRIGAEIAPWNPPSYTIGFVCPDAIYGCNKGTSYGMRWNVPTITYHRTEGSNLTGANDFGEGVITAAMAAWTNDCDSNVTLAYGGTTTDTAATPDDVRHTVEFNDPRNQMTSSSTVALTITEWANPLHTSSGFSWWTIFDGDIVVNDGYTASSPSLLTALTHEFGHALGFRHSNGTSANHNASSTVCNSANEECEGSATAIMYWQVSGSGFGTTLQPFDIHAVGAVYPGGSCQQLVPPTSVVATATTSTNINVSWAAATGAASYNVYRSIGGGAYTLVGNSGSTSYNDTVTAGQAYLYKVRSVNGAESGDSNIDLATAVVFTDSALAAGTTIQAAHVTELRSATNAVRALVTGLGSYTFTDPTITAGSTTAIVAHINDLRTALDQARSALGLSAVGYTDTTLAASTPIKAAHITDIRNGVK